MKLIDPLRGNWVIATKNRARGKMYMTKSKSKKAGQDLNKI